MDDGCCSEGEADTSEVVLDADIVAVSVADGVDDGLLAEGDVVDAGASVRVGGTPMAFGLRSETGVPASGEPTLAVSTGAVFKPLVVSSSHWTCSGAALVECGEPLGWLHTKTTPTSAVGLAGLCWIDFLL